MPSLDFSSNFFSRLHIKPFLTNSINPPPLLSLLFEVLLCIYLYEIVQMENYYLVSFTNYKVIQRLLFMISLRSTILFLRQVMFKYPITGFLRYGNLDLRKASRSEKQE